MKIQFDANSIKFEIKSSALGKEQIYAGGRLVSEKRSLGSKSSHNFILENEEYTLDIHAKQILPQVHLTLHRGAENIHEKWYNKQGKPIDPKQMNIPKFGWVFAAICAAIPILSGGGAFPAIIGFAGASGCVAIARNNKKLRGAGIWLCAGLATTCWIGFVLLIWFVGGMQGIFRTTVWSNEELVKVAAEANKTCPITVDADTQLDSVVSIENTLSYDYTLVNYNASEIDSTLLRKKMEPTVKSNACANKQLRIFLKNGVNLRYRYRGKLGGLILEILVSQADCTE